MAAIFTFIVWWLSRKGAPRAITVFSAAYFALNPVIAIFANCTSRDTLFSAVALLVALFSYDVLALSGKTGRIKSLVCLGLSCLLLCLLRNNGLYAFILLAVTLVLLARENRLATVVTASMVIVLTMIWFGPISSQMGVMKESGQKKEILAVPIQHLAYISTSGKLSSTEESILKSLGYVFPDSDSYIPKISDLSKYTIKDMSAGNVIKAYFSVAINHPKDCLYAELARTQDLWNLYSYIDCYADFPSHDGRETYFFTINTESPGIMETKFPQLQDFMKGISRNLFLQKIPLASLLVCLPFYFIMLLIALARTIVVRDRRALGALMILLALTITSYFGPCVLARYYMYLFFGLPLMFFALVRVPKIDGIEGSNEGTLTMTQRVQSRNPDSLSHEIFDYEG